MLELMLDDEDNLTFASLNFFSILSRNTVYKCAVSRTANVSKEVESKKERKSQKKKEA